MTELLHQLDEEADAEYELESEEGSLFSGTMVLIGVVAMAWAGVLFAFFYLREIDPGPAWRPSALTPPPLLGALIGLCMVLGMLAYSFGVRQLHNGLSFEFQLSSWLAVATGVIAGGLQIWELTRLGFLPGESGYTSVFVGFAILNVAFVLSGSLWSEMVAARGLRLRAKYSPETYLGASIMPEIRVWRATVRGCLYYQWFLAAMSILLWVVFYEVQ